MNTCFVCRHTGATLNAGPVGWAHPGCFESWDRRQEALECGYTSIPDFEPRLVGELAREPLHTQRKAA